MGNSRVARCRLYLGRHIVENGLVQRSSTWIFIDPHKREARVCKMATAHRQNARPNGYVVAGWTLPGSHYKPPSLGVVIECSVQEKVVFLNTESTPKKVMDRAVASY